VPIKNCRQEIAACRSYYSSYLIIPYHWCGSIYIHLQPSTSIYIHLPVIYQWFTLWLFNIAMENPL
jgi:hypothetical protein